MSLTHQPVDEVHVMVVRLHDETHLSFAAIARQLEVTPTRANQIYRLAKERLSDLAVNQSQATCLLPGRARWVLEFCGYKSCAEVRAAMESGELEADPWGFAVYWRKTMLRSVSCKTWSALYEWAGRPCCQRTIGIRSMASKGTPPGVTGSDGHQIFIRFAHEPQGQRQRFHCFIIFARNETVAFAISA